MVEYGLLLKLDMAKASAHIITIMIKRRRRKKEYCKQNTFASNRNEFMDDNEQPKWYTKERRDGIYWAVVVWKRIFLFLLLLFCSRQCVYDVNMFEFEHWTGKPRMPSCSPFRFYFFSLLSPKAGTLSLIPPMSHLWLLCVCMRPGL